MIPRPCKFKQSRNRALRLKNEFKIKKILENVLTTFNQGGHNILWMVNMIITKRVKRK